MLIYFTAKNLKIKLCYLTTSIFTKNCIIFVCNPEKMTHERKILLDQCI